ncbi:hypothetical protein [Anaerosalibacter sp. Marseille-P3206]|uniref:hypothetical protein n=1 Tax=Anaerosalibacter sp. Marseille-P3206 TaxID=1871005 RepID=UPI0009868EEF|nr:hypothetical protein [Anaerosalibacter sp. Marseille-P3206]
MTEIFRNILEKDIDLSNVSNSELKTVLDEIGRDAVYNHLLFGKDYTYDFFIKNLKSYLDLYKYLDKE